MAQPPPRGTAGERIVDNGIFSAVVIMVIVTTMATPPALAWSFSRGRRFV